MKKRVDVPEEVTGDNEPHLSPEVEQLYRDVIRAECAIVAGGYPAKHPDLRFARGFRWGLQQAVTALGHADLADSILQEEIETYARSLKSKGFFGRLQGGAFEHTMAKIITPGSRLTSSVQ